MLELLHYTQEITKIKDDSGLFKIGFKDRSVNLSIKNISLGKVSNNP